MKKEKKHEWQLTIRYKKTKEEEIVFYSHNEVKGVPISELVGVLEQVKSSILRHFLTKDTFIKYGS